MDSVNQLSVCLIISLLFNQAFTLPERSRRGRCEEKAALQGEIRTLRESQEILHGEIVDLKFSMKSITNLLISSLPEDCSAAKAKGSWSTTTMISPPGLYPREVKCEQKEDGGGWTVILSRGPPSRPLDFNATWQQYKDGFGDINGEFWIGNDALHSLTREEPHHLRIVMKTWKGTVLHATWHHFTVAGEEDQYKLGIRDYQEFISTANDALSYHNNHPFSTYDAENDLYDEEHCAEKHGGGWWYHQCYLANPTGVLLKPHQMGQHGMIWRNGSTKIPLKNIVMMIRPSGPSSYLSFFNKSEFD